MLHVFSLMRALSHFYLLSLALFELLVFLINYEYIYVYIIKGASELGLKAHINLRKRLAGLPISPPLIYTLFPCGGTSAFMLMIPLHEMLTFSLLKGKELDRCQDH